MHKLEGFGSFLNDLGLGNIGVAVCRAENPVLGILRSRWRGRSLLHVDPANHSRAISIDAAPSAAEVAHFVSSAPNSVPKLDVQANQFEERSLDFVYLDHEYLFRPMLDQLRRWLPTVRDGGVLAGGMHVDGFMNGSVYGVRSAVREFATEHALHVSVGRNAIHERRDWQ